MPSGVLPRRLFLFATSLVEGEFEMTTRNHFWGVRNAPSAHEIKRICRQIRAGWSPAERTSRIVKGLHMWLIPFLSLAELRLELTGRHHISWN
jgi:hypothetical protein